MDKLREMAGVRQVAGEPPRRWFSSLDLDLIVWNDGVDVVGFQLCYDKRGTERAITWRSRRGFDHARVEDGAHGWSRGTPLLVADGRFAKRRVHAMFLRAADEMPDALRTFVAGRLLGYPLNGKDRWR